MNQLVRYFVRGCLATVPVIATVYILYVVVTALDTIIGVTFPGLGLLVAVVIITLIGFALSNVLGRRVYGFADQMLARVPLVKLLYTSIRDLIGAFMGPRKTFGRPVSVKLSAEGDTRLFGFITRDNLGPLALPDHVAVYFPQAYNFAGQLLAVPKELVEPLETTSSELITFLVSGGVSGLGMGRVTIPPDAITRGAAGAS